MTVYVSLIWHIGAAENGSSFAVDGTEVIGKLFDWYLAGICR